MASKIRRQINELTPEDISSSPVWEFALDEESMPGQDECTLRPLVFSGALDPAVGMLIVAARFQLADGTRLPGYLTPPSPDDNSLGRIQPVIVTDRGQILFWCGRCAPEINRAYQLLGREAASVFPIRFESAVPLIGGGISGTIRGFLCLQSDFVTIRVVR